ncbi:hypothetical protein VPH234P10_0081 [Vibrio phage 234P10]|nr:hypothetical protein SIPHO062v1_p0054 [Vibrio phage PS17B.1]
MKPSEFERMKSHEDFERFVKQEFSVKPEQLERSDQGCYAYSDKSIDMLWFMWNAGYWTRQGHILTYGCEALHRFGVKDIQESMRIEQEQRT